MTIRFNHTMIGCQNLTWIDKEHLSIYILPALQRDQDETFDKASINLTW